jgi:F-type H+-transporting ATPase subunit delta
MAVSATGAIDAGRRLARESVGQPALHIALIFGVALGVRLALWPLATTETADATTRVWMAWDWLSHPTLITHGVWGPLHFYLMAPVLWWFQDRVAPPIALHIILASLTPIVVYFFTRQEFDGRRASLIVGLVFAPGGAVAACTPLGPVLFGPRCTGKRGFRALLASRRRVCDNQGNRGLPASSADASGLAGRYAAALFELAEDRDALDAVAGDLRDLQAMLGDSADLRRLIRSPVLSREDQGAAIVALAERAKFDRLTVQFLGLLAQKRRLFVLPEIIAVYRVMLARHRGEVSAELVSAVALSEAQIEAIKQQLAAAMGQAVTLSSAVDPGLLGGLVVRVGSRMIDASLRTKLQRLELAMKGAA